MADMITAYPLTWPLGYPRTPVPKDSIFRQTLGAARDGILHEIKLMHGVETILSTNIPLKKDGLPWATYATPADKGVAVYFTWNKKQVVLACDKWNRIEHNMHAIRLSIQAMRGLDRWGVSQILERSFQGFQALPGEGVYDNAPWWEILGVSPKATDAEIKDSYRKLIIQHHPDRPHGDLKRFQQIQRAYKQALPSQLINQLHQ
jgi:hypothetical protein